MDFEKYRREFDVAVSETSKLDPTTHQIQSDLLLSENVELREIVTKNFAHIYYMTGPLDISTSCAPMHINLKSIADRLMPECRLILTHGWVRMDDNHIFETSLKQLKREIRSNKKKPRFGKIDIHTWLTCIKGDAIEIYDFTLACFVALKIPSYNIIPYEAFIFSETRNKRPDINMQYHPILIGVNVLSQLNITHPYWEPPPIIY